MVDALSFVDVDVDGQSTRQIFVNGSPFIEGNGRHSTQLVEGVPLDVITEFLDGLFAIGRVLSLPIGRHPLGYCDQCFSNDGWIVTAAISVEGNSVYWRDIGTDWEGGMLAEDRNPSGTADWVTEIRDSELAYEFDRSQYEAAIAAELARTKELP